jgi:hypothetical protein
LKSKSNTVNHAQNRVPFALDGENRDGAFLRRTGPGFRAQLLSFLNDLAPSLFGKPVLTNLPERSQIAW